jgi:aspartate 1-decarboxylase
MMRIMMKSKIHRATVTQADLDYVGSITLDRAMMEAADLLEGEQVAVVDVTNGARIETYVIAGKPGSGAVGINGAAAHHVHPGDLVIIMSYGLFDDAAARALKPTVVHVDSENRIVKLGDDASEPVPGSSQVPGNLDKHGSSSAERHSRVQPNALAPSPQVAENP